jgi:transcriptional regulator with XRE-family HTH domain
MLTLSDRLQWVRKRHGLTQRELAKRSGVGLATIRRIEQQAEPKPQLDTVKRLATVLHVREAWLAWNEEPMLTLADMTSAEQKKQGEYAGRERYVLLEPGPWYHDGETWRVIKGND